MGQLEEQSEISVPEQTYSNGDKQPLLRKYNIPIQHFDFSYVEGCTDGRELEKILQVLKSGEEGYYPELLRKTEARLAKIKPNSKYIRKLTRVLSKNEIDNESSKELTTDLNNWLDDINRKNTELTQVKNAFKSNLPAIRKSKETKSEKKENAPKRIASTDYAAWDKYDPETEILKMDLEEEKLKKEAEKLAKEKHRKRVVKFNEFATTAEASFEGQRENIVGNECFKAGEYEDALEHYTNSINCFPNATSYANRGATYLSLKKYKEAISDYKDALKYESKRQDCILQLGKCYSSLGMWTEALDCAEAVIKLDPNNKGAQKLAEKAKKSGGEVATGKVRFKIVDVENKPMKIPKKSILKKDEKSEIIPIPGSSKMNGPYYKVVHSQDPQVIKKEKQIINNYPKRIFMTSIEINSDDDDDLECIETHISPTNCPAKHVHGDNNNNLNIQNTTNYLKQDQDQKHENYWKKNTGKTSNKPVLVDITSKIKPKVCNKENEDFKQTKFKTSAICQNNDDSSNKDNESNVCKNRGICEINEAQKNLEQIKTVSIHNDFSTTTSTNQNEANHNDIGGGGEPYVEDNSSQINAADVNMPFSFIQAWQSVRRDGTYYGFASILRNLNIDRITEVIGNKIDATILSEILNCLYRHFMVADEIDRVYSILLNLCRLERFCIVIMFLSANDKKLVQNVIDFLKQHGKELPDYIKKQYM